MTATVSEAGAPPPSFARPLSETGRERLRGRLLRPAPQDGIWGWVWPLAVTVLAGVLRLVSLGQPRQFVFDETYYAKDAFALLRFGHEMDFVDGADKKILRGNLDVFTGDPSYVVHPPLGKWLIAGGEQVFGMNPFGWRVVIALLGTLSVLVLARTVRRMTQSTAIGTMAGFLLAIDGIHVVMSRTALLDLPLSFFVLLAFAALVVDRDDGRRRVFERLDGFTDSWSGPRLGLRPWRIAAGVLLGMACAVKWNGAFYLAAFGLLTVVWDIGARRMAGARMPRLGMLRRDALPAFLSMVPVAVIVYVASWVGWLRSDTGYYRQWAASEPAGAVGFVPASVVAWVPDALRSLWHYHAQAYSFHVDLTDPHSYESHPWGWLLMARPVSFFYEGSERGDPGCTFDSCAREVIALGNPVIWWGGVLALVVMAWLLVVRRDWRAGAALVGVGAGWLPWLLLYSDRTIFSFYTVVFAPFLVMAVALTLGLVLGPRTASPNRRGWGVAFVGGYLLLAFLVLIAHWPLYTGGILEYDDWWRRLLRIGSWV